MKPPSLKIVSLIEHYFMWHYGQAYLDILNLWKNFIWFIFYFFSIKILFRTMFEPWKRMGEEYPKGFAPMIILQTLVVNTLMRIVGFIIRAIVIAIGLSLSLAILIIGVLVMIIWTIMPIFLSMLIILGISLVFFG